jgi:protein SCO1/2
VRLALRRLFPLVLSAVVALLIACRPTSTLPVMAPSPEYTLIDQSGQPFSSSELAGKVVVTNFVFTTCTDICPLLTGTMTQIQSGLKQAKLFGNKAVLVSISVDPENDTPAALTAYAEQFGADTSGWRFLTGDAAEIEPLLITGFRLGAPPRGPAGANGRPEIVHTSRFVVADPAGQIRWYPRGEEVDPSQVIDEVKKLAG